VPSGARHHTGHRALGTGQFAVHAALTTVALLFSANYIISKLAMHSFTPLVFAYLRVLGSAIILNTVVHDHGPIARDDQWRLVGFALLAVALNQSLFLGGLALTSAHIAAILITTIPVFALGAAIVMRYERATPQKLTGIALAAAGALLVVAREGFGGATKSFIGDLLIISNSLCYALYLVLSKPMMARLSARRVIARMFAIAAGLMIPLCAWSLIHQDWRDIPARAWLGLALVILGPTVAAYLLNAWALAYAESSVVATYSYLQPVATIFLAAIFLGETLRPTGIVAMLLIFGGIWLASRTSLSRAA
jgi:drug/metabolite transporter (DMT)-like permease